jgi:hypothetical protein
MSQREKVARWLGERDTGHFWDEMQESFKNECRHEADELLSLMGGEPGHGWIDRDDWNHAQKRKAEGLGANIVVTTNKRYDDDLPVWIGAAPPERNRKDLSEKVGSFSDKPERDREAIVEAVATYLEAPYPKNQFGPVGDDEYDSVDGNLRSRMHAAWARHWANVIRENKDAILGGGE